MTNTNFASLTIRKAFIILCIIIVILAALEGISSIILSKIYSRKFDSSLIEKHKYGQRTDGLKANASGAVWGKPFHTDEMGGRRQTKKKPGKPKLLVIGDSVTEGVGVDDSATFANLLNEKNDSMDVRNISLIGWSSYNYRTALDEVLKTDSCIKTVYLFYCLNDVYGNDEPGSGREIGYHHWIGGLNRFMQDHYATYKLVKLFVLQNSDKYFQYDRSFYKDTFYVNRTIAQLTSISDLCKSKEIKFEVFILPYRSQLQGSYDDLPQRLLIDQFNKKGINYLDLLPDMAKARDPKSLYLFADEIHLSAIGHRAVADAIFHR